MERLAGYSPYSNEQAQSDSEKTQRVEIVDQETKRLIDRFAKLFLFSFRFSQGDAELQSDIFKWLSAQYPELCLITADLETEIQASAACQIIVNNYFDRVTDKTLKGSQLHTSKQVWSEGLSPEGGKAIVLNKSNITLNIRANFVQFIKQLADDSKPTATKDFMASIVDRMSAVEVNYLLRGRTRSGEADTKSVVKDPYASFLCSFALMNHSTGMTEYDELFRQIAEHYRRSATPEQKEQLNMIIELYKQKHPGVALETLAID